MKKFYFFLSALFITVISFGQTQMDLPVTFDDATVNYGLVGFGGAEQSTIITDPTLATNKVGRVIKTNTAELWAGATVTALNGTVQTGFGSNIPFAAGATKMNVRVWSPHAGIQVRLKAEDKNDPTHSCETEATVTVASGWQTLEFNFANQAPGTAALNFTYNFNKVSIFFNFGVTGAIAGERTYYFDDVKFGAAGGGGPLTQMDLPVTFDDATVNYGLVGFGGAEQSTIVTDPTLATNKVGRVIKTNTAELWAGATVTALNGTVQTGFGSNIPFAVGATKMNVRVWSPHAGIQVRLKAEDKNDPTHSCETEATVTVASGWQTLEFNFANQAPGTAALNFTYNFNKVSIFFNFGVTGAIAGERTYYFDDVKFGAAGGGGPLTQMDLPVTFDDATVNYGLVGFGGAEQSTIVTDPTLATNKVGRVIKTNTAELWAGATVTALNGTVQTGFGSNIPFAAGATKMNVRVWSPHAGIQVRLKAEDKNDPNRSCETEATVTVASGWQTLEFNFANQAPGTAALNFTYNFNKVSIFFNFGVTGAIAGERTYYFDDVKFGAAGGGGPLTQMDLPVTFDDATVNYGLVGFGGAEQSTIVTDPTLATNKVGRVIKTNTAELWAGATVTALNGTVQTGFGSNIPFAAGATKMNVRVWSPHAGIQVRLKAEDKNDPNRSCETEATVTVASGWQTLEFNFANQAPGTAALNFTYNFNKVSIFFNFGVTGAIAGERTYYFDDVKFGAAGGGGALTQMDLPVTFDDATVNYGLVGFGGAEQSTIVTDPTLATNKVGRVIKTNTAELWAGATVTALNGTVQTGFGSNIPFAAGATKMNVRVWSPHAGIQVRLKAEDKNDPTHSCETEATVTVASGWQTLEFNFANQAPGTAALNFTYNFNKVSIFFNFGVTGAIAGERTYYFDDVKFGAAGGGGPLTQMDLPVTFDDATVNYGLVGFGGAEQSTIVTDPTLATNKVGRVIKTNTAELWAGATVTALNGTVQTGFGSNIPFAAGATKMNVRVWSPHAGIQVRLKAEDKNDPTHSCETEATVTVASGWQTLEFNFANQAPGTAALNFTYNFNKVSIFFNFGVTGAVAGERTYYFDDVQFGGLPGPSAPSVTSPVNYCQYVTAGSLTAMATGGNTLLWYTSATGGTGDPTAPIPSTANVGTTNYYVSQVSATFQESPRSLIAVVINASPDAPVATTSVMYCKDATARILSATATTGTTLNWYTVATGGVASLNAPTPVTSVVGNNLYYVTQVNGLGCESLREVITVKIVAPPTAPVIDASVTKLFPGQTTTISLSGLPGTGNSLAWYKNGILLPGQTGDAVNVNIDGLGDYTLGVTNTEGCVNSSNTVSISELINGQLFIYPNPSSGKFQVRYFSNNNDLTPRTIVIYDSKGAMVYKAKFVMFGAYTPMNVYLGDKGAGIYYVHLLDAFGKTIITEKVSIVR